MSEIAKPSGAPRPSAFVVPVIPGPEDGKGVVRITLIDWQKWKLTGKMPAKLKELLDRSPLAKEIIPIIDMLGLLEPSLAHRPGAGLPTVHTSRYVEVGPATERTGGDPVKPLPVREVGLKIGGAIDSPIVVHNLRAIPANLGALKYGAVEVESSSVGWRRLCPDLQGSEPCQGLIHSIENFIVMPGACLTQYLVNYSSCTRGKWLCEMQTWSGRYA